MILQKDIDKILNAYKEGEVFKASQIGKSFYRELPSKVKKVVEVANFFSGVMFSSKVSDVLDYTSYLDVILSKSLFLEGDFEKYRNTAYKVLETTQDTLTKLYCLKEIKMFDEKRFSKLYPKYSGIEISSKRSEYLRKFLENDFKGAIKDISEFLSQKPHPEIILDLADIWYYTDQYRELSELCLSMYKENRINDYFLYLYAYSLFSSGRIPDSISLLERLAKKYPRNINIIYNLAVSYFRNGNYEKAIELINLSESILYSAEISFVKGIILYKLGRYKESKNEFLKIENNEEFQFSSKYNISLCDYHLKNYEDSISRLINLRNEKFVDRKNFEAIDKTIWSIKRGKRKISYPMIFLLSLISSFGLGIIIYLIITNFLLK